jgi:hypothetical protein
MKRTQARTFMGIIATAGGLTGLLAFPVEKIQPAIPTIKVPGDYPYEETVHIPAPTIPDSAAVPSPPPPFHYPESGLLASAETSYSRTAHSHRRPLSAKTVREAAFKYNGVPKFFQFLAVLPANVSVLDPKLGTTRAVVKAGRVMPKSVAWLRKREQTRDTFTSRTRD